MPQSISAISRSDRADALPWPLIGAGLAAMTAFYFTRERSNWLIILAIALIASRFTSWRLPSVRVISWGARVAIFAVVLWLFNTHSTTDTTVWYLNEYDTKIAGFGVVAELVLRAWERPALGKSRESRGVAVLVTVLIFLAATHTYEREAIQRITPVYMICMLLTLRSFAQLGQPPGAPRTFRPELAAMRAIIFVFALSVALATTSLTTRFEAQISSWSTKLMRVKHPQSAEIGFSMDPHLGNISNPKPTMDRILLIDGPPNEQHLRTMAFDTYASPRWLPVMSDRKYRPAILKSAEITGRQWRFTRVSDVADLLPLPLEAAKIEAQDELEEDDLATLRDQQAGDNLPYDVTVPSTPSFQGPLCSEPDAEERRRLLAIPAQIDPKVIELARQVAGDGDQARQIIRIQQYLQSDHAYSLRFDPQGEPLNDFILNHRSAHCQYFASAVVMMARAVGIPARFVSGFYAHERYGSNEMVVRSRDAHAWAECWIDRIGWMTVDATPSDGRPDAVYPDPPAWKQWWEKLSDVPGQLRTWLATHVAMVKLIAVTLVAAVVVGSILTRIFQKRGRTKVAPDGYAKPSAELIGLARRFEKWLLKKGNACPPQRTWRDHLASATLPADTTLFVQLYNRARFGSDGSAITRAKELLRRLENEM